MNEAMTDMTREGERPREPFPVRHHPLMAPTLETLESLKIEFRQTPYDLVTRR